MGSAYDGFSMMNLSDALWKVFLENNEDFFLAIFDSGLVIELNHNVESICMIDRLKIIGSNFFDTCKAHSIHLSFNLDDIKKLTETTPPQNYIEVCIKREKIETALKLKVLNIRNENRTIYILIGTDITELLHYKKSAFTNQSYLQSIIENLPQYVYWKDSNFVYQGCNKLVSEYLHLKSPKDIVGKTDQDFGWSNDRVNFLRKIDESIFLDGKINTTEDVIPLNNISRIMLSTKAPLHDKFGKTIGIVGVSVDITELKETQSKLVKTQIIAEKEQEMRKTIMTLIGDIVHDLKTPISMINGAVHILDQIVPKLTDFINESRELKSEKLKSIDETKLNYVLNKMVFVQKKSINMINEFINATLRELSVANRYQDGVIAREDLNKCSIRRILENVMEGYPRHEKLIINQCFSSYDFIFMGNSILMMKVLFNLIKNSEEQILANGKGEITITTKDIGEKNLLIITDTAGGAPLEVVENFFKDFFTTKKNGTGIGLAFCKKIMRNFGGDIVCQSNFGESIEFILSFPKGVDSSTSISDISN